MKEFLMKDLGEAKSYLGLRITRNRKKRLLWIDQESYIDNAIKKFGLENAHPANTPLPTTGNYKPNDEQATPQFRQKYQSIIGTILYIMLGTRPDIAYSVTMLSRFATNPSESHWRSAIHILRYLKGMKAQKLQYDGSLSPELNPRAGLIGFSDSTWASDTADRCSITGHAFFIANGTIS